MTLDDKRLEELERLGKGMRHTFRLVECAVCATRLQHHV
jgi:hypothetical protein